jgi:hypothetical protein
VWSFVRVAALAGGAVGAIVGGYVRTGRSKQVELANGRMTVIETGALAPVHEGWPLWDFVRFGVEAGPRAGRLVGTTKNGARVEILTNESPAELTWVRDRLDAVYRADGHPAFVEATTSVLVTETVPGPNVAAPS